MDVGVTCSCSAQHFDMHYLVHNSDLQVQEKLFVCSLCFVTGGHWKGSVRMFIFS